MQTRSKTHVNRREEIYVVPLRKRVVTRSMTRENQLINEVRVRGNEAKKIWFYAYIKKCQASIAQTQSKNLTKEEKMLEKVRIIDEMFYNTTMYIGDIIELSDQIRNRLVPVMIHKALDLRWEIYERVYDSDKNWWEPYRFTKKDRCYLENVMKNLKKAHLYLVDLQSKSSV